MVPIDSLKLSAIGSYSSRTTKYNRAVAQVPVPLANYVCRERRERGLRSTLLSAARRGGCDRCGKCSQQPFLLFDVSDLATRAPHSE